MPADLLNAGTVRLTHGTASADILLFGATVLSATVADGRQLLFLSRASALDGSAAVRGGIPVVFPLFGEIADVPADAVGRADVEQAGRHGFARTQTWTLERSDDSAHGASVTLVLDSQKRDDVLVRYPFPCLLRYTITLAADSLSCKLAVHNTGTRPMHFHALLHNYLNVPVAGAQVSGLNGSFRDKVSGREEAAASGSTPLTMDGAETDRVYADRGTVEARDAAGRGVRLARSADGFAQTVLWNPGEKGAGMKDMHDGGEAEFVCVEPGYVAELKALAPGEEWVAEQTLSPL